MINACLQLIVDSQAEAESIRSSSIKNQEAQHRGFEIAWRETRLGLSQSVNGRGAKK
jgi:hypothetical protein